jgi:hypothetical protein
MKKSQIAFLLVSHIFVFFLGFSTHFSVDTVKITHVLNCNDVPGICKDKIKTLHIEETLK